VAPEGGEGVAEAAERVGDEPPGGGRAPGRGGIVKRTHQIATATKASRVGRVAWAGVAAAPEGRPTRPGLVMTASCAARSAPPPR